MPKLNAQLNLHGHLMVQDQAFQLYHSLIILRELFFREISVEVDAVLFQTLVTITTILL